MAQAREYEDEFEKQVTSVLKEYGLPLLSSEANTSMTQLQQKVEMLERIRSEVAQVNSECNEWKAQMDVLAAAKKEALAKVSALEIQLRNARESNSVQVLEADLTKAKAEIEEVRAEAKEIQVKADKKVAIHLKDATNAQMELRGPSIEREEATTMLDADPGGKPSRRFMLRAFISQKR